MVQFIKNFAHLSVDEADAGEVGAFEDTEFFWVEAVVQRFGGEGNGRNVGDMIGWFLGKENFFEGVKFEIFFRGDVRNVRAVKAHSEEEWLVFVFLEQTDGFSGDFAVRLFFVCAFGFHPAEGRAELMTGCEVDDIGFVVAVASAGINELVP